MPDQSIPDQFSDQEMEQIKRHGAAQLGGEKFSEQVEKELDAFHQRREANAGKMKAAQTGGGLGPSEMDDAAIQQRNAMQQESASQGQQQAAQAQGAQKPPNAPPAPTGPVGTSEPYPSQRGPQPQAPAEPPAPEEDDETPAPQ